MAHLLNNLAILFKNSRRFTEAEEMYKHALEIYQRLAKDNPKAYEPDFARTLYNLGILYYNDMYKKDKGKELFQKSLVYYHRFAKDNTTDYQQKIETIESILGK